MIGLLSDFRFGVRTLSNARGHTAVAALTLALGMAANTAVLTMAYAIVYRPFPFPPLDRIVAVSETIPKATAERYPMAAANYFDMAAGATVFDATAAYKGWNATLIQEGDPQRVHGYSVSPSFFALLGVPALHGRTFSPHGSDPNQIVISYGLWQALLGGASGVIGRPLQLNGLSYTIVGIMPKDLEFPIYAELYRPWIATPAEQRSERLIHDLGVVALLKPGVPLARAQRDLSASGEQLARAYPASNQGRSFTAQLLRDAVDPYAARYMAVVSAAVAFLLLLACANVANLNLARTAARRKEIAVRAALGATRGRIARQFFIEGILVAFTGAAVALPLSAFAIQSLQAHMPALVAAHLPGLRYVALDARALLFLLAAAVVSGIALTLPAALQISFATAAAALKDGARGTSMRAAGRMRSMLAISEIGLALVLLIAAALMVSAVRGLSTMKQGFDSRNVLTFRAEARESAYADIRQVTAFYDEALRRIRNVLETDSVALISELPALADSRAASVVIEGQPRSPQDHPLMAEVRVTSGDYFRTMRIPLLHGRVIGRQDDAAGLPVAVISKTAAQRWWPRQDALGQRLTLESDGARSASLTIVGIVGDVNHFFLDAEVRPAIYLRTHSDPPAR